MSRRLIVGLALGALALAGLGDPMPSRAERAPVHAAVGAIRGAGEPGAVANRYIVLLADDRAGPAEVDAAAGWYARRYGGTVTGSFGAVGPAFAVELTEPAARRLAADPGVSYVEQDRVVTVTEAAAPPWNLDRIDQRDRPLSGTYRDGSASAVTAYILDTGVRLSHREFGGRARSGYDFVDRDKDASDCHGHGTHVAGTVGGASFGVVKDIKLVSVRVLDCQGTGTYSQIIAGVNWVAAHAVKPAVANLSLGGPGSAALDAAVKNAIASGVTFVVAAGNSDVDACTQSPARVSAAITVGATTRSDARASWSNHGSCLDLFAPGVEILSAYRSSDTAAAWMNGTSMATPHVSGAAALILAGKPAATPRQVRDALAAAATPGAVTGGRRGSPDALLYLPGPTAPAGARAAVATCGPLALGRVKPLKDRATLEVRLAAPDCAGSASARTGVRLTLTHPRRGDLAVTLIAPDGTAYAVRNASTADRGVNLNQAYTVDASAENRRGTWTLRITDRYRGGGEGLLRAATLTL